LKKKKLKIKKGKETRCDFDQNTDHRLYPLIEYRAFATCDINNNNNNNNNNTNPNDFNKLPTIIEDVLKFDLSLSIKETPTDNQIEAYIACLVKNTICFMPKESGKNETRIF
jgi:hypothetical protein